MDRLGDGVGGRASGFGLLEALQYLFQLWPRRFGALSLAVKPPTKKAPVKIVTRVGLA